MESRLVMGVFLLAVLLLDIQCNPLSWGLDPMYDDGYTEVGPSEAPGWNPKYEASFTDDGPSEAPGWNPKYEASFTDDGPSEAPGWNPMYEASFNEDGTFEAPGFYEPELQMDPGYESGHGGQDTSYESGHGGQDTSYESGHGGQDTSYESGHGGQDTSYESGHGGQDTSYESGHGGQDTSYESGHGGKDPAAVESQHFTPTSPQDILSVIPPSVLSGVDTGPSTSHMSHPKPSPGSQFIPGELLRIENTKEDGAYESETQEKGAKDAQDAMVNTRPPQPKATMPMGSSEQPFPYDLLFLTGQYARGTYPDFTKSVERGRDDWQVNHYRRYDDHAEDQRVQSFPSASDKSFLTPSMEAQKESKAADVLWPRSKGRSMMSYYW
ncbi:uncharacterized protein LOC130370024 [Gadus chalcogrammus]|uniref:uncharacterized protein LOC130370024 n=1 Tax=Gadus chalcogrammus TaxID=1042646 RepID=UPI0024C47C72|nr:uncharacterized protein LOC130370024 [Gadus chalcogrammus]